MKKKYPYYLPKGWSLRDVQKIIEYYDNQSEEEAAAEIEGAFETDAVVIVPKALLPRVRKLIAESRRGKTRSGSSRRVA